MENGENMIIAMSRKMAWYITLFIKATNLKALLKIFMEKKFP